MQRQIGLTTHFPEDTEYSTEVIEIACRLKATGSSVISVKADGSKTPAVKSRREGQTMRLWTQSEHPQTGDGSLVSQRFMNGPNQSDDIQSSTTPSVPLRRGY